MTLLAESGIALRAGQHCAQPLLAALGVSGTLRASFAPYNTQDDVAALVHAVDRALGNSGGLMTTLHPFGTTITDATLRQIFAPLNQWEDKYRQLILLGKKLPTLTDERKAQAHEIAGCENRVWLGYEEDAEGRLHFFGDSEGRIVRGLLAVLLTAVEGKTRAGILGAGSAGAVRRAGAARPAQRLAQPGPQRPERGGARRRPRKLISRFRFPAAAPGGETIFRKPQRHAALSPASSSGHATPRRSRRSRSPSSPRQSRKRSPSASALPPCSSLRRRCRPPAGRPALP